MNRFAALSLFAAFLLASQLLLAQDTLNKKPAGSSTVSNDTADEKQGKKTAAQESEQPRLNAPGTTAHESLERSFPRNFLLDQKTLWTSPLRIRAGDSKWLLPIAGMTAGLIAADRQIEKELPQSARWGDRSHSISQLGVAAVAGATGGAYLWGRLTKNDHLRETGVLSAEAVANSFASLAVIKAVSQRERPLEGSGEGKFWQGGSSFPSEHAAAAWSVASIIAHEYPGRLTKLLAYGTAGAISVSRVTGRQHFASDVFVGSLLGWWFGRQVYRSHHDFGLGGGSWGGFDPVQEDRGRSPEEMGSPYVPLDSWVYPLMDRMVAFGYVQSGLVGQRPWTRMECARLTQEAGVRMEERESGVEVRELYRALTNEFADELGLLDGGRNLAARLESVYLRYTGISGKPLTDGYHFGQTLSNDFGRPYAEGSNVVTGFSASATAGPLAFYIRGEFQHAPSSPPLSLATRAAIAAADLHPSVLPPGTFPSVDRFQVLDAYVAFNVKNFQMSFGKESLWWGPGRGGPMLFSDNAEPITMLRIDRVSPFKLPWIFRLLGPIRTQFFVGQLSGHHFVNTEVGLFSDFMGKPIAPQPFIHGQKFSFKPTPNLEFSVSRTTVFGGPAFPFTLRRFANSLVSGGNSFGSHDPGDRRSAVDVSYRVPGLRDWLTFYVDSFAEDEISPLGYPRRSAFNPGIYLPQIPGLKKLDFRAEGVYTAIPGDVFFPGFFYSNVRYFDGYTNQGRLLGSWIGRQGHGVQLWSTYWISPQSTLLLGYRTSRVVTGFLKGGAQNDIAARADLQVRPNLSISAFLQFERWEFPLLSPGRQRNVTASFQLTFRPSLRIR